MVLSGAAVLVPRIGKKRALKISIVTGSFARVRGQLLFCPQIGRLILWDC